MVATFQINKDVYTLSNGTKIPAVGLGTWRADSETEATGSTLTALKNGYKHIDTAAAYDNEEAVGEAIAKSGVPRNELFITTKLWNTDHKNAEKALDESLKKLKLDYVDLYLMHWPVSENPETGKPYDDFDYVDTWKALQEIYKKGDKVKAIGVSNFTVKRLERLLNSEGVDVKPVVNQIEAHPLLTQPELYNYLKEKDILIEAYSPLGSNDSPLFKNETVKEIAKKNEVDPAQVLVSWAVQRNTVVLPKSVNESRIISNIKTFKLSDEDFETLNSLNEKEGPVRTNDVPFYDFND